MEEVEVPLDFLCPISFQLMRDPVTVSTGITYDRESIERWLFSCKNYTCPVTKQPLLNKLTATTNDEDQDHLLLLTPNHTLRRLIQAWCTLNASYGIERIPTPKPPIDKLQVLKLLSEAKNHPNSQLKCLQNLKAIASQSERNKRCLEAAGTVQFLAFLVKNRSDSVAITEAAVDLLFLLVIKSSDAGLKKLVANDSSTDIVDSLVSVLKCGNYQSRANATVLLKSILDLADPIRIMSIGSELFKEVVSVLRDQISQQASKASLKLLMEICPWGRNRIKAVEGGVVSVLIEMLLDTPEKRVCELTLVVLDQLCSCAEGRAELLRHGAGIAVVSKKILRVSHVASDRAVRILSSVCRFSATSRVLQEMLQVGIVAKLCLVLQVESSLKTKEKAKEILKLHSRVWKSSKCIPSNLLSSYPSS
ncbi:E3 ubiquitin-protein ligase PUB23-like [Humulus lupulus]|uniref:E3 ubiquitin-protein ligase PUB23-like n=1 Tax=Humulus lupulus TaxID=3486 RepID=UPI002B417F8E|nr:E3 ubiquitin-protein ligase PUB23-like [Humulus lupulus]